MSWRVSLQGWDHKRQCGINASELTLVGLRSPPAIRPLIIRSKARGGRDSHLMVPVRLDKIRVELLPRAALELLHESLLRGVLIGGGAEGLHGRQVARQCVLQRRHGQARKRVDVLVHQLLQLGRNGRHVGYGGRGRRHLGGLLAKVRVDRNCCACTYPEERCLHTLSDFWNTEQGCSPPTRQ
jgi:hypothetical protein